MADQPSAVSGALRRPFAEQVAFFRLKLGKLVPTRRWDDLTGAAHDTAFMVAGAQKADLLADLAASLDRATAEGKSLEAFRKDFAAAVERHDWHGWTGEGTTAGEAWRTRVIYRTNTYVAYAAGRRAQLEAANWKFWIYLHGGSKDPRPEHLHVFNGLILPPDHPFWIKFYPPSDWGCSCYVVGANTLSQAKRLGGIEGKTLPDGWDVPDPATGEPLGIGKGWGYAPGASVAGTVAAAVRKSGGWQYQIAKAFIDGVPRALRDQLARSYRELPSVTADVAGFARAVLRGERADVRRTLGPLTADEEAVVGRVLGASVDGYDWSVSDEAVRHVAEAHGTDATEEPRGQRAVTAADLARLPLLLRVAPPVPGDQAGAVVFRAEIDGELTTAVFVRSGSRRTLVLKTFYVRRRGKKRGPRN